MEFISHIFKFLTSIELNSNNKYTTQISKYIILECIELLLSKCDYYKFVTKNKHCNLTMEHIKINKPNIYIFKLK